MLLRIKQKYPWGEETGYIQKIYNSIDERMQKHFFFGIMQYLSGVEAVNLADIPPKFHQIVDEEFGSKYFPGDTIHFALEGKQPLIRFCPSVTMVFRQDIELIWAGDRQTVFVDGLEVTEGMIDMFLENEGLPDKAYLERLYPSDFKGWVFHWGYRLY